MGKSNWAKEDYTDFNLKLDLVPRSCCLCAHAERKILGDKANDCHRCIETGWQVKKNFKAATRSKANAISSDEDLQAIVQKNKDNPGVLVRKLLGRKIPELARLSKILGLTVKFGSTKEAYVNEIIGGVI